MTEKKYVKPKKIVLDDGFTGQTSAGTSMEEALRAMEKPFADIVRNLRIGHHFEMPYIRACKGVNRA